MARQVTRVRVVRRSSTTFGGVLGGLLLVTGAILIPISMANDPTPERQAAAAAVGIEVTVVREIDGDTLEVRRADGVTGRVRLVGINSPELAHDGQPAQCGAEMARDLLRPLRGQTIRIAHDASQAKTDKYDRTLAYARHDGLDVGAEQIAAGAAREYTYGSSFYEQRSEYVRLQDYAPRPGQRIVGRVLRVVAPQGIQPTAGTPAYHLWTYSSPHRQVDQTRAARFGAAAVSVTFTAEAPNALWLIDITEHRTDEGKLYLCAIKDVWSNRIVGYSIDSNMKATLAVRALHPAIDARPHQQCVLHSDRSSQFRSKRFLWTLRNNGLFGSMGRVAACADNAAMEGPFRVAAAQRPGPATLRTRQELRLAIVTWMERTYHGKRRQRRLGKLTPIEFETINKAALAT